LLRKKERKKLAMNNLLKQLKQTKKQLFKLSGLSLQIRDRFLTDLSALLLINQKQIIAANKVDLRNLKRLEMRDRLELNEKRIQAMSDGLLSLAKLPDPLNKITDKKKLKNGLSLSRISVPLGVLGIIYESRPNVTIDLAGLAIKSGNALVLKGGREAYESNKILVKLIRQALQKIGVSSDAIYLIDPKDNWQKTMLTAHGLIDVVIPRGSNHLIEWVRENSRLPVIETGAGVCHIFVDKNIDAKKAAEIIVNAKTQRPDVCNALDTLVIHRGALNAVLPLAVTKLASHRVEILADSDSFRVLKKFYPPKLLKRAKLSDYGVEFLSQKMSIKTVETFDEGLEFVKEKTSGHSESILSKVYKHIAIFLREVDAAVVYGNVSTRFTDGWEFGMGAEVGISTQKLHARGPMGLEALTSYKWLASGNWLVRK
jgi:glutamate-5-semialdehyde dehydrogenase